MGQERACRLLCLSGISQRLLLADHSMQDEVLFKRMQLECGGEVMALSGDSAPWSRSPACFSPPHFEQRCLKGSFQDSSVSD